MGRGVNKHRWNIFFVQVKINVIKRGNFSIWRVETETKSHILGLIEQVTQPHKKTKGTQYLAVSQEIKQIHNKNTRDTKKKKKG